MQAAMGAMVARGMVWTVLVLAALAGPLERGAPALESHAGGVESPVTVDPLAGAHGACEPAAPIVVPAAGGWTGRTRPLEIGDDGRVWEVEYEVAPGDTLWRIATRFRVPVGWVSIANGLGDPGRIRAGQRLRVPLGLPPVDPRLLARLPAPLRSRPERLRLTASFGRWAERYDLEPDLLMALAWVESGWQHAAVSHRGAIGIGQLVPETVDFVSQRLLGLDLDPWTPEDNIRMSARFLRYLLDETGGDAERALAAYYQGLGALRERGIFPETRPYVTSVLATRRFFDAG